MKPYREQILRVFLSCFLFTLLMIALPPKALASATLELINNRSETVKVALRTWDVDQNTNFTQGWITINPHTTNTITIEHRGDWQQVLWLYAFSKTMVWQGDPNTNLSDPDISAQINTLTKFQYWGKSVNYPPQQKGWKTVYFFFIEENGSHDSFTYTFD